MNRTTWAAIIAIVLGIIFLFFAQVGIQNKKEVFRFGDFTAATTTTKTYPALRYIGGGLIVAGLAALGMGYLNRR